MCGGNVGTRGLHIWFVATAAFLALVGTSCAASPVESEPSDVVPTAVETTTPDASPDFSRGAVTREDDLSDPRFAYRAPQYEVAYAIEDAVKEHRLAGFTGITLETEAVVLRWKGEVPKVVDDIIDQADARVEVRQTRFTLEELLAAGHRLSEHPPAVIAEAELTGFGPTSDFTALQVLTLDAIPTGEAPATFDGILPALRRRRCSVRASLGDLSTATDVALATGPTIPDRNARQVGMV